MYCCYHFCAECARRLVKQESHHPGYSRSGSAPQDLSHHTHLRSQQEAVSVWFSEEVAVRHNTIHALSIICWPERYSTLYVHISTVTSLWITSINCTFVVVVAIQVWPPFWSRCSLPRAHLGVWQPVFAQCPRSPAGWCLHHTTHRWAGSFRYVCDKH